MHNMFEKLKLINVIVENTILLLISIIDIFLYSIQCEKRRYLKLIQTDVFKNG